MTGIPSLKIPAIRMLADHEQWVCYRREARGGKPTKVPITPDGDRASTTDPATWSSFADCVAAYVAGQGDGLGFVLTNTPFVGIDLDHCVEQGRIRPDAHAIMRRMASYTECSPSGEGLHIIARGSLPPGARRRGWIESYETGRYFTVTGDVVEDFDTIESRPELLRAFHAKMLAGSGERAPAVSYEEREWDGALPALVQEALDRVPEFARLLQGTHESVGLPSESELDWALACELVASGFTPCDVEATLRWRRTRIGKAKSPSYFPRTVANALGRHQENRP